MWSVLAFLYETATYCKKISTRATTTTRTIIKAKVENILKKLHTFCSKHMYSVQINMLTQYIYIIIYGMCMFVYATTITQVVPTGPITFDKC